MISGNQSRVSRLTANGNGRDIPFISMESMNGLRRELKNEGRTADSWRPAVLTNQTQPRGEATKTRPAPEGTTATVVAVPATPAAPISSAMTATNAAVPKSAALSPVDVEALLDVLSRLLDTSIDRQSWPGELLANLGRLIPFELGACHCLDHDHRMISACYQPESPFVLARRKEFSRLTQSHPLNALLAAHPAQAFRLSDAIPLESFVQTELYELLYRPLRINRELVALIPDGPDGRGLLVTLHRWGSDFTERDRTILNLLLPRLAQARSRPVTSITNSDPAGQLAQVADETDFFAWGRKSTPWQLTRRESDVLFWLSQGKTNAEIGQILGMAERTAETHALRLYPKIGVENRYNAIAMLSRMFVPIQKTEPSTKAE